MRSFWQRIGVIRGNIRVWATIQARRIDTTGEVERPAPRRAGKPI